MSRHSFLTAAHLQELKRIAEGEFPLHSAHGLCWAISESCPTTRAIDPPSPNYANEREAMVRAHARAGLYYEMKMFWSRKGYAKDSFPLGDLSPEHWHNGKRQKLAQAILESYHEVHQQE